MNFIINRKAGYAYDHVYLPLAQASTFHMRNTDLDTRATANINPVEQQDSSLKEIDDDWTVEEEKEWDALFAQPHVQVGLSKLAEEANQQVVRGEFEEGGFAVE